MDAQTLGQALDQLLGILTNMRARTDAVVVTRVTALKLEISTAFQLVDDISNWMVIFADEDDITAAQLSQLEQINNLLSTGKAGATHYFARLPCLYSAVEEVFRINYQVDVSLPIVPGDAYQVAARMDRAIWYLNHVVIQELMYVWVNIGNVGIFPNGPGAILSRIMKDLVNMHLLIGREEALKINAMGFNLRGYDIKDIMARLWQ